MSVTVEDTHVGRVLCSRIGVAGDVGKETCIYRFPIGKFYLRAEVVPVVDIAYGHEEFLEFFQIVERRLFLLHKYLHVEADAGSEEIHHLVALLPFGGAEHVAHGVYGDPVAVFHDYLQHHLCAVVPYAAGLVGILPGYARRVGILILPVGRKAGYAQQVQPVGHNRGAAGAAVVVPPPVLGHGAAHAVAQLVERAVGVNHALVDRLHKGAVYEGEDAVGGHAFGIHHHTDVLEVVFQSGDGALYDELVGKREVLDTVVCHAPLQLHLLLLSA